MAQPRASASGRIAATVAIPLHNHAAYIGDLLESLFAQWRPDFELLLIDDHSTDGGLDRVHDVLARHPQVRATTLRTASAEGVGLVHRILDLARGRVIIRSDSDDIALPGRLKATMACFEGDERCLLVSSNALLISDGHRPHSVYDTTSASSVTGDPLEAAASAGDTRWLGTTMAYRRHVYDAFPLLDDELCPYGLDMLLPFRATLLGTHHYIAEPLVGWRQHRANTHRVAGQHDLSDAAQEPFQALLMTVLAQKLRDAEYLMAQAPTPLLGEAVRLCRVQFQARFDAWSRLRTRRARSDARAAADASGFAPPMPPIATLEAGEKLRFASGEFMSRVLPHHSGFNAPEAWGVWTERVARLELRIVSLPASPVWLELALSTSQLVDRHRVAIRVDMGDWIAVEMEGGEHRTVVVALPAVAEARIVGIEIVARDAVSPAIVDPTSTDRRLIGIGLISVGASRSPPTLTRDDEPSDEPADGRPRRC